MATIFVSYKREDGHRAQRVIQSLRDEGLDVWWDQGISSGSNWRAEIRREIENARVIVVLWSKRSVGADWVLEEAEHAKERGVLFPILIESVSPPLGFRGVQAARLDGWSGNRKDPAWLHVVASIKALASGRPPPEGRPPKPRLSTLAIGLRAAVLAGIVLAGITTLEVFGITRLVPRSGGAVVQALPGEAEAWRAARDARTREAYAGFLVRYPRGLYAPEAQASIAQCQTTMETAWTPREVSMEARFSAVRVEGYSRAWTDEAKCSALTARVREAASQSSREQIDALNDHPWDCPTNAGESYYRRGATPPEIRMLPQFRMTQMGECQCHDGYCEIAATMTCHWEEPGQVSVERCG